MAETENPQSLFEKMLQEGGTLYKGPASDSDFYEMTPEEVKKYISSIEALPDTGNHKGCSRYLVTSKNKKEISGVYFVPIPVVDEI